MISQISNSSRFVVAVRNSLYCGRHISDNGLLFLAYPIAFTTSMCLMLSYFFLSYDYLIVILSPSILLFCKIPLIPLFATTWVFVLVLLVSSISCHVYLFQAMMLQMNISWHCWSSPLYTQRKQCPRPSRCGFIKSIEIQFLSSMTVNWLKLALRNNSNLS